ncbi:hypothetical protein SHIRM173S_10142 [Streptomyces hirsutus]
MYDHVGGEGPLRRLAEVFHRNAVADPIIGRLFNYAGETHVRHLTAYLVEVFGHGSAFTDEIGGFEHVKKMHADLRISDEQRDRFVELMLAALDETGLPQDERFRTRFEEQPAAGGGDHHAGVPDEPGRPGHAARAARAVDVVTGMPSAAAGERVASVVDAVRETFGGRAPATGEPVLPPGADSMTALALALALEDRLGVAVPPSLLRDGHDAAALAERLAGEHDTAAPGRRLTPAAGPAGLEPFSPRRFNRLISRAEEELTPDAVGCHHYREFTVPDLDADRLRAAWSAVRQRHTMLRCALVTCSRCRWCAGRTARTRPGQPN